MRRSLAVSLLAILPALVAGQTRSVATFFGVVVDSVKSPIANAEVSFPGMSMQASTNDKRLEAVEWYADAAQTPARYSARDAQCGVAILHQRKSR